jgi:hypothetical protein
MSRGQTSEFAHWNAAYPNALAELGGLEGALFA